MKLTKDHPFVRGYMEAALWASTDESDESGGQPMDENYSIGDIADETVAEMIKDCEDFYNAQYDLLQAFERDDASLGHDFWLTRNHHGAGFWDRYSSYGEPELYKIGEQLTDASHVYGEYNLYVVDDGLIYGM